MRQNMIEIALLEDNKEDKEKTLDLFKRYQDECHEEIHATCFEDGLIFLEKYKPIFDVIFMDIKMPNINGLQVSHTLRKYDFDVPLVFLSNLQAYAIKGYEVQALDYLIKPIKYIQIK